MKKKTAVLKTIKKFHSISFYNLVKKKYWLRLDICR